MNREIFRLAIPNILSNISVPLLSTVDTALMGRLTESHLGAVGLGAMAFNFIYWNFGFLRMGTTGITAQALGANDKSRIIETLFRALLIAAVLAVLLIATQGPLARLSSTLLNADDHVSGFLVEYFFIRIWAAPASLGLFALMGWYFGMQNSVYPLIVTVFLNVVNIGISYYMVVFMGMEIAGVAWGTVIAQYAGLLMGGALFLLRYRSYLNELQTQALRDIGQLRDFVKLNFDILLRTLCLTLAFGFFYSQSSEFGASMLAVNVILLQYVNWMSYAIDGFAFATESIVGKYYGARDKFSVDKAIGLNFMWAGAAAVVFALVYGLFGRQLLSVFTDQTVVVEAALPFMVWMVVFPVAGYPSYIWDGVYIGLTASKAMRNSMALAFVVFLAVYFLWLQSYGNHGLWAALVIFLVARGVFQWILYRRHGWSLR